MKTARLIMGDQLSHHLPSLIDANPENDIIIMGELAGEASMPKHHKRKIALIFSAMRHFADELAEKGFTIFYHHYDAASALTSFDSLVKQAASHHDCETIIMTEASEYRVLQWQKDFAEGWDGSVEIRNDTRFMASHDDFALWAKGKKQLRMEFFYREMRRRYQILMAGDEPVGGKWNYDADNRKPPKDGLVIPAKTAFAPDNITNDVLALIEAEFADHVGELAGFDFAVTASQAEQVLDAFIAERLADFGHYQDAMITDEPFMYHAHIGFYLNIGLLDPRHVIQKAEEAYHAGKAPLNAVEGFIRQILGWREYIRGIYWLEMPDYANRNHLQATRPLPSFFWNGKTNMRCLSQTIGQTIDTAYAHHIQRLMVIGNFALLAGLSVKQVNEWYLIVYADAFEWVEMPNVSGMVLYADGGIVASKPYAAGGAYIDRMSDYCKSCHYKVKVKNGPDACPFNYLYWDFLLRHETALRGNPRLGMIYRSADKMTDDKKAAIKDDARRFLDNLET
ncbi:MAG: cryptochrome/photolyase family protein [Candidatus Puniceispirillaceae bacterium]